jgi:uncharacterized repeat protein (TIGR02543 family)
LRCVARGTDSNYAIYYNLNGGGVTDVPSTYQEIDYIQSTGTQFINTGVQMNKTDTRNLEFKVYYDQAVTYTFGVNAYLQYPNTARTGGPYIVKDNYNGSTTTQTIYENDTLISTRDWSTYSGANLYIGLFRMGNPDGGWYGNYAQAKLYYAKITDENNNLIRDLVPVRRISDYVVGLYDKVTGNFYTNAGSGTFNSGGNIFNTDTITPQTGTVGASSINTTLSTKNPTKSGYTFYGWCPGTVSNNNSSTVSCSTTSYQPGATYTVASGSGAIKMNAMWYSANTTRTFYLNFNMNSGSDTVTNIPANITTTSSSSSVTFSIPNTIPIRTGYTFIGWSTSSSATTPSYYAGGTFTTSNTNNTLYAVWRLSMQNWTGCNSLAVGSTIELADTRDREIYLIGKLADNHCWMLDNLRLDPSQASVKSILSSTNTNANDTALYYFRNGGGSSPYATSAISSSWVTSFTAPYVYVSSKDTVATHYGSGTGKIGVYYNFCAASAGSYCYADGAGVNVASTYKDAQYDICPAGWRMPIGDVGGEYGTLYTSYSYNLTNFRTSLSTTLSGWYTGGTPSSVNSIVYYLTSTFGTTSTMYIYQFSTTDVNASLAAGRQYGLSVRCMMESTTNPSFYRIAYRFSNDVVGNSLPGSCNINEWCTVPNPTRSGYKFLGWQISNMNPGQNHFFMFNTDSSYQTTTAEEFPIVDSTGTSSAFYMWNARTINGTIVLAPAWQVL